MIAAIFYIVNDLVPRMKLGGLDAFILLVIKKYKTGSVHLRNT